MRDAGRGGAGRGEGSRERPNLTPLPSSPHCHPYRHYLAQVIFFFLEKLTLLIDIYFVAIAKWEILFALWPFILSYSLINENHMIKMIVGVWLTKIGVQITFLLQNFTNLSFVAFPLPPPEKEKAQRVLRCPRNYKLQLLIPSDNAYEQKVDFERSFE